MPEFNDETNERTAIVYGIRDKATGEIRYVGQATDLLRRQARGYTGKLAGWIASSDCEFVELERTTVSQAADVERANIERLLLSGARLFNVGPALRSRAHAHIAALRGPCSGGPGRNKRGGIILRETSPGQLELWTACARASGLTLSAWIREACNSKAHASSGRVPINGKDGYDVAP